MRKQATYISEAQGGTRGRKPLQVWLSLLATCLLLGVTLLSLVTLRPAPVAQAEDNFDPIRWTMCLWGKESLPHVMYQTTQTEALQFALHSKSAATMGHDQVDFLLNQILAISSGHDFVKTNEAILGYDIYDSTQAQEDDSGVAVDPEGSFNKGPVVNPYDRFGVAGLNWTSYMGEWKYVVVDACNPSSSNDPKTGLYYNNRLVPQATWADIGISQDIRTKQFSANLFPPIGVSIVNTLSNGIFILAKVVIVLTIAFINFAFSDIVSLMGLNTLIGGNDPSSGMFGLLFQGIFMPLVVIIFVLVGISILYTAIVQRQYRKSLTTLLRSVALYIIAVIISINPLMYISLPNTISVGLQAIIVQVMSSDITGGNGLCETNIGSSDVNLTQGAGGSDQDFLTQVSKNMSSALGCSLWQQFLLKPWAQGQFGMDWNKTWAKGNVASWAKQLPEEFNNDDKNVDMVGDAAVPLGGGQFIHNWAIFQISTQTNAHSPIALNGQRGKYTSGISNDWWRIVDVVANYTEKEVTVTMPAPSREGTETKQTYYAPNTETKPLVAWDYWTGNSVGNRFVTASSAVFVASLAVAAPLFFALIAAAYSIGLALLMAFAPVMLLLGCWPGKGWEIFKAWGQLVYQTFLKRVVAGLLLVVSIIFSSTAIGMMQSTSWLQGVVLMALLSLVLISSRKRIMDSIASVRFAAADLGTTARKVNTVFTQGGRTLATGAAGGVAARKAGGTFKEGAFSGMKSELKNYSYQSPALSQVRRTYDNVKGDLNQNKNTLKGEFCDNCGDPINEFSTTFQTTAGNYLCYNCGDGHEDPSLVEMPVQTYDDRGLKQLDDSVLESAIDTSRTRVIRDKNEAPEEKEEALAYLAGETEKEIAYVQANRLYSVSNYPPPPEEIAGYLDIRLLHEAWSREAYDYIRMAYSLGWASWFVDTVGEEFAGDLDELVNKLYKSRMVDMGENPPQGQVS